MPAIDPLAAGPSSPLLSSLDAVLASLDVASIEGGAQQELRDLAKAAPLRLAVGGGGDSLRAPVAPAGPAAPAGEFLTLQGLLDVLDSDPSEVGEWAATTGLTTLMA